MIVAAAAVACSSDNDAPANKAEPGKPKPAQLPTAEPAREDETASAELLQRLAKSQADLKVAEQTIAILASPFPKQGPEVAGAWQEMVGECDLAPHTADVVECTEYPCFLGIGRDEVGPEPTGPDRLKERLAVEDKLRACPAIVEALGKDFEEGAVIAAWQTKTCGGKDLSFWSATVLDPEGPGFKLATEDEETERESEQLENWAQRRIRVLKLKYPCPPPSGD